MEDLTLYFIIASILIGILGYLLGSQKLYFGPVVIIAIFILLMPLIFNGIVWIYSSSGKEVIVPNILGYQKEEAISILKKAGLNGEITTISFSKETPGTIISQDPPGGKKVKQGRTISLSVSAAEKKIPVPNLIGRTSEEAESLLSNAGLTLGTIYGEPTSESTGLIINQDPLPDNQITPGSQVSITISTGSEIE